MLPKSTEKGGKCCQKVREKGENVAKKCENCHSGQQWTMMPESNTSPSQTMLPKKRGEMLPKSVNNAQKYCQRPTSDHCILNCKKVFTWAHPPPLSLKIMYLVGFSMGVKWNKYKNWY